ncbi:DUF1905 domain-containing protein [Nesterenkonia alkaliphila]|uniref:DUF1905 domain-containing protein n=1 Tax=Nesterenkonia alkaliphila TaxID=1463631 RepID=A0A7K1UEI4_9MICC|nr:DUF1905 domain-containing protein [Nesterenkonia alkaliphila]MVT24849.1 DUF1905 domain-containing protein [Nesterenkonia alkaliphila]GFZ92802.1 hypothetical protein GCM10011359_22770 [Nesterenkonia alkaliphila]
MEWQFEAEVVEWRGPAPYLFAPLPKQLSAELKEAGRHLMYWGQLPVIATIGSTEFNTAMWPKDGHFLLPLKAAVRRAEGISLGDCLTGKVRLPEDLP